jgi:hypothetical protein
MVQPRSRCLLIASIVSIAATSLLSGTASAYDGVWLTPGWNNVDEPDVISDCEGGHGGMQPKYCTYHEISAWNGSGNAHEASDVYANCTSNAYMKQQIPWSYTTSSSTFHVSSDQRISYKAGDKLSNIFSTSITKSSTQQVSWSIGTASISGSSSQLIAPGRKGAFYFSPQVRHSSGWLEVVYPNRNHGHWNWYYDGKGSSRITTDLPISLSTGNLDGQIAWQETAC